MQLDANSQNYAIYALAGQIAIKRVCDGARITLRGDTAMQFKQAYNRLGNIENDDACFQAVDALAAMYFPSDHAGSC
jgi:hypothetical protein